MFGYQTRYRDLALIKIRIVVFFNAAEIVQIINHQAGGLMQAVVAEVSRPVDGVQAGAIT